MVPGFRTNGFKFQRYRKRVTPAYTLANVLMVILSFVKPQDALCKILSQFLILYGWMETGQGSRCGFAISFWGSPLLLRKRHLDRSSCWVLSGEHSIQACRTPDYIVCPWKVSWLISLVQDYWKSTLKLQMLPHWVRTELEVMTVFCWISETSLSPSLVARVSVGSSKRSQAWTALPRRSWHKQRPEILQMVNMKMTTFQFKLTSNVGTCICMQEKLELTFWQLSFALVLCGRFLTEDSFCIRVYGLGLRPNEHGSPSGTDSGQGWGRCTAKSDHRLGHLSGSAPAWLHRCVVLSLGSTDAREGWSLSGPDFLTLRWEGKSRGMSEPRFVVGKIM